MFRLRRRERIEVQAIHFLAVCLHFCPSFFASFFAGFWTPPGIPKTEVGVTGGHPLLLFNKVHYTTVLAPLRGFSLQPKGFFRRTRGRIVLSFAPSAAAGWHFDRVEARYGCQVERRSFFFLSFLFRLFRARAKVFIIIVKQAQNEGFFFLLASFRSCLRLKSCL